MLEKIHNELNQRKSILIDRDHDLDGISEEDIKSELQSQGISYVLNFTKKWNYLIEPTNTSIKQSIPVLALKISEHSRDLLLQVLQMWLPSNLQLNLHVAQSRELQVYRIAREKNTISLEEKSKSQKRPGAQGGRWPDGTS